MLNSSSVPKPHGKVALFSFLSSSIWFWSFGVILVQFLAQMGKIPSSKNNFSKFYVNVILSVQNRMEKWHFQPSRPLHMVLVILSIFGPLRPKISQIARETQIFLLSPRLYLPIGIQKCPQFFWYYLFDFCPGLTLAWDTCVGSTLPLTEALK